MQALIKTLDKAYFCGTDSQNSRQDAVVLYLLLLGAILRLKQDLTTFFEDCPCQRNENHRMNMDTNHTTKDTQNGY